MREVYERDQELWGKGGTNNDTNVWTQLLTQCIRHKNDGILQLEECRSQRQDKYKGEVSWELRVDVTACTDQILTEERGDGCVGGGE